MFLGFQKFQCTSCGATFKGLAHEYGAIALISPVKCPQCGSWHTRPWSSLPAKIANQRYIQIWELFDKKHPNQ